MSLPAGTGDAILVLAETPSTFVAAFEADPPLGEWQSVLALSQTRGVGQLGRAWVSPPGNLYASVRLPAVSPFTDTAAAPAVGALLAHGLRQLGIPVLVKWPNDLVLSGDVIHDTVSGDAALRKVGGILIQQRGDIILAGVGLNIDFAPDDSHMRAQSALPAGRISEARLRASGVESLADLWQRIVSQMRSFVGTCGMPSEVWQDVLREKLAFRGEMVTVLDERPVRGRLLGVDAQGGLRLQTIDGETVLYSGSLQVRGEFLE